MSRVYMDIVRPLPEDEYEGAKVSHILTMMDGFTMWAEAVPIAGISAEGVACLLVDQWIVRYGIPKRIHSDQGVQFTSDLFNKTMALLGIRTTRLTDGWTNCRWHFSLTGPLCPT